MWVQSEPSVSAKVNFKPIKPLLGGKYEEIHIKKKGSLENLDKLK